MAYAHSQSLRWSLAYVRAAGTARLRRGLIIVSVAVCAFLLADATKSLLALVQAATEPPAGLVRVSNLVYLTGVGVGALAFVAGVSYAAIIGMLITVPVWRAHRRGHRQLAPLWRALHEAFPQLALGRAPATSWRARLGAGRTHYRFYRRVVEIRDGLVLLSPYYDTALAGRAGAGPAEKHWAGVIAAALRRRATGAPVAEADPVLVPGGDDLESDARLLAGIARELAVR
jgi:hypothetical protein